MGEKMNAILKRARGFWKSRRGNVAMMFGLCMVPVTVAAGVGLDYVRAVMIKAEMSEALDSAALAVGSTPGLDKDKALALAQKYFAANYKGDYTPVLSIADGGYVSTGSVTITANVTMKTALMKVVNITDVPINTSATVVWGQSKLWVSLVLDNSGSMDDKGETNDTKMDALKTGAKQLLTILQTAASTDGDIKVSIVPFDRNVNLGKSNYNASWIDWTDWESPPPNVTLSTSVGPNSQCPFTDTNNKGNPTLKSEYDYYCTSGSANSAGNVANVPSSGLICPGVDNGDANPARKGRYYNGCWDSVIKQTKVVTKTEVKTITSWKADCSQKGSGTITCTTKSGYPVIGSTTSTNTVTTYESSYSGDSGPATTSSRNPDPPTSYSDGSKSCSGSGSNKTCTWTRTYSGTMKQTDVTVTKTAYGGYTHTWIPNDHSTWQGCIMDRTQDYDIANTAPSGAAKFPAENKTSCLGTTKVTVNSVDYYATVLPLTSTWTTLTDKITAMKSNDSTNQPIGMAHGWQTLSNTDPHNPGAVPANTTRYIILFSDGLNTRDRWYGNGQSTNTTDTDLIDGRMDKVCQAAKDDGIIVYAIFLNVGNSGNSQPLEDCASDSTKYFALTTTGSVTATFNQIAQQITNVRVSK